MRDVDGTRADGPPTIEQRRATVAAAVRTAVRHAEAVVFGFTIGAEAGALARRFQRWSPTGDETTDAAALDEFEREARRVRRKADKQAGKNGERSVMGVAGLLTYDRKGR